MSRQDVVATGSDGLGGDSEGGREWGSAGNRRVGEVEVGCGATGAGDSVT